MSGGAARAGDGRGGVIAAVRRVARRVAKDVATLAALVTFRPVRDALRTARGAHPVRVFTFHRVMDLCRDPISLSPEEFRERVAYIARNHDVVDLDRALRAIGRREKLRRPLAVITFDDAYRSVFEQARPILAEGGLTACCFAPTRLVGTDLRFAHDAASPVRDRLEVMSWAELEALRSSGWSIGAHTATHRRLSDCRSEEYEAEIREPLQVLRDRLGLGEVSIAYPYGGPADIDGASLAAVMEAGYTAGLSNYGGENFPGDALFDIKRYNIGGTLEPLVWRARVHGIELGALRAWIRAGTNGREARPS